MFDPPATSRIHKPTPLANTLRPPSSAFDRKKSMDASSRYNVPKINKNTERMVQNREQRLKDKQIAPLPVQLKQSSPLKSSDKYLLGKFNREFDEIKTQIEQIQADY